MQCQKSKSNHTPDAVLPALRLHPRKAVLTRAQPCGTSKTRPCHVLVTSTLPQAQACVRKGDFK